MKTLYISDLDGTLLNKKAEITEYTKDILNKLYVENKFFSIATARTSATVIVMLSDIKIRIPIILMNGACIFDMDKNKYVNIETISANSKVNLFNLLDKFALTGFLYTIKDNVQMTYYENLEDSHRKNFHDERVALYKKPFTKVEKFSLVDEDIIYFSVCDNKEKLMDLYNELKLDTNINIEFYRDIYMEDYWYLEVLSSTASKANGIKYLKKEYFFDNVVSFGDNLNDIPMFLESDLCFAVENAKGEVKNKATAVIDANTYDGVARWLDENVLYCTEK